MPEDERREVDFFSQCRISRTKRNSLAFFSNLSRTESRLHHVPVPVPFLAARNLQEDLRIRKIVVLINLGHLLYPIVSPCKKHTSARKVCCKASRRIFTTFQFYISSPCSRVPKNHCKFNGKGERRQNEKERRNRKGKGRGTLQILAISARARLTDVPKRDTAKHCFDLYYAHK